MNLPEYHGHSIVNLINSLLKTFGHETKYPELKDFSFNFDQYNNVILIVVDGMGYEFLKRQRPNLITNNIERRLTSVFPTTTASAISSFLTGEAPLQHAMTGWYMYFKELGVCGMPLPFCSRYDYKDFEACGIAPSSILDFQNIFNDLNLPYVIISPEKTIHSSYSNHSFGEKNKVGYTDARHFFEVLSKEIQRETKEKVLNNNCKMIYAYYPYLDETAHMKGLNSVESIKVFEDFSNSLETMISSQSQKNLYIITADHGLVDIKENNKRYLKDYPQLSDCLILPLCGEARVPYCYVRPGKTIQFKNVIQEEFGDICRLMPLEEAVSLNLYGLGSVNPKFYDRVGDFILHFKEEYILIDHVLNEKSFSFIGYHGGLSKEELYVPLVLIR